MAGGRARRRRPASRRGLLLALVPWLLATFPAGVLGETAPPATATGGAPALTILPLANHTGDGRALEAVMQRLHWGLRASGVPLVPAAEIRPLLRRHRIRVAGAIGSADAALVARSTGTDHLLIGSIDFFDTQGTPEFGLSVRILRVADMRIVKAASAAATGEDYAGLFGIGRIETIDVLIDRVVEQLIDELGTPLLGPAPPPSSPPPCASVAIIPLDGAVENLYGGDIASVLLLNELTRRGFAVVEPGVVDEVFRRERVIARGQLGLDLLAELREEASFCLVVTGYVDGFELATGDVIQSTPKLGLGLRALDARDGTVITATATEALGTDSELLFRIGRVNALGRLTGRTLRRLIDRLADETEDYLASTR